MRDYGRVHSTFWSSATTASLSDDGKLLALYLLTCSHSTIAGVFRLPDGYASEDLGWSLERVSEGFSELFHKGFANRCGTTKWVVVEKHLDWNPPENPNQRKAAAKVIGSIPDECAWKQAFMRVRAESLGLEVPAEQNPLPTVSEPFRNQEQKQEQKQHQELEQEQHQEHGCGAPPAGDEPPPGKLARRPKAEKPESASGSTWAAYAKAYLDRYGAEPVRNAKVNGQLASFVARIGAEEAPGVARFFVGHQGAFYVRGMHAVDALLKDAEKLRTEWATGRRILATQAAQADRTATNHDAFQPLIDAAREREAKERANAQC